jgi:peptidoglycan hydrolase-like protein with peptidoglycan-binding domain
MRQPWPVIGWLPLVLLTACVTSHPGEHQAGTLQPAVDRLLNRGDIQVAQMHLRAFGFDPGPIDGLYTAETRAAVRAYQARYGLPATGLLDYTTRLRLIPGLDYDRGEDR